MTNYECFSDWAWGHIEDVYDLTEEDGISLDSLDFILKCAREALSGLSSEEQDEVFGFTLAQVKNEDLLDHFYAQYKIEASG